MKVKPTLAVIAVACGGIASAGGVAEGPATFDWLQALAGDWVLA